VHGIHVVFGKRSDQQRTAEDRARAAAERAARRAGRPLPPEAFQDTVQPPDVEPHTPLTDEHELPEAPAPAESPPPSNGRVDQRTVEYTPFQTDEQPPVPPEPEGEEPRVRHEPRLGAARRLNAADHLTPESDEPEYGPDGVPEEPPPPPRLRPAPERPEEPPRRPAPAKPRRRPPPPAAPRSSHWGRRIFAVIALAVIAGVLYVINGVFQPFHGDPSGAVQVTVPEGADSRQIGDLLAAKGVIENATFFQLNATVSGKRGDLRPGHYVFQKGMSNGAVIDMLTTPPKARKPPPTVKVTFTEGPSRKEMAPLVDRSKKVEGSYIKATQAKAVLARIRKLGAPKGTKTPEGFLFPATYTLTAGSSASKLVGEQLDTFQQNFNKVDLGYAKRKHLTRYDVLTIASMIEREAQIPRERPLVAAVIYNRLKQGMPLGIDATIRYYINNWSRPIRVSELEADEPYNTRLNRGLPPTPIGNPGLASIQAAAHPARKSYLYFVRKPGKSGEHAFSSTDAQFERDQARYQASREDK
jgi:uncharacterized YceG family protein